MADLNCFYINQTPPLWDRLQGRDCLWALVLDPPESDDMRQIQTIAVTMDAFMRTSEVGFSDVHLVLINRPEAEEQMKRYPSTLDRLPESYRNVGKELLNADAE